MFQNKSKVNSPGCFPRMKQGTNKGMRKEGAARKAAPGQAEHRMQKERREEWTVPCPRQGGISRISAEDKGTVTGRDQLRKKE